MTAMRIGSGAPGVACVGRGRCKGSGSHHHAPDGCGRGSLAFEATIISRRKVLCGCLFIARVTYRGEVLLLNIPNSASGRLTPFFPPVPLSSIHDSFAACQFFLSRTKSAYIRSATAAQPPSSAAPPPSSAAQPCSTGPAAAHSTRDRSTRCAESPARTHASR